MALPNLFSRRKRIQSAGNIDVYTYDKISNKVKVQIIQIIADSIGDYYDGSEYEPIKPSIIYDGITKLIRQEQGKFCLTPIRMDNSAQEVFNWFLSESDVDPCLDFMELSIRYIDTIVRKNWMILYKYCRIGPDDAIDTINARLREASIGYQFENGVIIRIDSQVIHQDVIIPALQILSQRGFEGANKEYRSAHSSYRAGDFESCLTECCKAFESTLKIIGSKRRWGIKPTDSASKLLDAAYKSEFIPQYLQAEFSSLRSLLESGIPTIRNKMSGHGAGPTQRVVPRELAAFQLHQTGAAIIFLAEHDRANS